MSHYGYADFHRPVQFDAGTIYYPFGGGPFSLTPHRCSVADVDDGRTNFALDIIRPALPQPDAGYAILEMRLEADYASDRALAFLRSDHPHASLSHATLSDWEFRLVPGPVMIEVPPELLNATQMASNNLGSARMVMHLSIESGILLESLLMDEVTPVNAVAEAQMEGVSPRVNAVVRFKASQLMPQLIDYASAAGIVSYRSLVRFFTRDLSELPMAVSGQIDRGQMVAFGEAMADRIIGRFGSYVSSDNETFEPQVKLMMPEDLADSDHFWSLSQPFLASRRIVLHFDLLSDVRQRIQDVGTAPFVRRHTASAPPSVGQSTVTVYCNLPPERVGVAALGATLTFPPKPPMRPHGKSTTVEFEPPQDIIETEVHLSPGEPVEYEFSTFAVIADEHGVRQVDGPRTPYTGSPLRLGPEDFPLDFVMVEASEDLIALASIAGVCSYEHGGREYEIPFELDSGLLSASLALPKNSDSVSVQCTATARGSDDTLTAGPYESRNIRLDLTSFEEYGWHEVEFECVFDGNTAVYAIDVLPDGVPETFENTTILAFTPANPSRRFGWFAFSPFRPGFRYRPHQEGGAPGIWHEVPNLVDRLVIRPEQARTQIESEAFAISESSMLGAVSRRAQPTSESAQVTAERQREGIPISPEPEPTDLLLYSDPADPTKKLYIPRYWVDMQRVSGQEQYRVSMAQQGTAQTLAVHLIVGPAKSLGETAREAREFPHERAIYLEYLQAPPSGARKILEFTEVTRNGAIVTAKMTFATLQERDEVYRALTETNRDTKLIVKRTVKVAVPQSAPSKPKPTLVGTLVLDATLPPRPLTARIQPALLSANTLTARVEPIVLSSSLLSARIPPASEAASLVSARLQPAALSTSAVAASLQPAPRTSGVVIAQPQATLRSVDLNTIRTTTALLTGPRHALPVPKLSCTGTELRTVRGKRSVEIELSITNWKEYSKGFFAMSSGLRCGKSRRGSRTQVDIHDAGTDVRLYSFCAIPDPSHLTHLSFSMPASKRLPERVYAKFTDRRTKVVRKSNVVRIEKPEPPAPVYRVVRRALDQSVRPEPFTFLADLHSYVFQGIVPGTGGSGLVRFRIPWQGKHHTYLQDVTRPHVVYFFPDEFKIARRQEAPFTPFITVRVSSNDGSADTTVVFDYIVAPYTQPRRLTEARQGLLADPKFSATHVELQSFFTSDVRFYIDRPTQLGTVKEERSGASLVLQGALKDTLVMDLADFGLLFDAMHRDTASLFLGRIEIDVPGEDTEVIPFTARMDDLVGELFLYTASTNSDGSVDVSLMNAIESPIQIDALEATINRGEHVSSASIQGLVLPVENLAPGSAVHVTVSPETPLPGSGTPQVQFNLENVQVTPDPAAIWDTILDRSTLQYFDTITVKAISNLFEPVAGRGNDQIVAILVEFEGGGTAELSASRLEEEVRIDYPIDDVILRRDIDTSYRYTVTVVRADGRQERDAEPRQQSARIFFVNVQK